MRSREILQEVRSASSTIKYSSDGAHQVALVERREAAREADRYFRIIGL